MSWRKLLDKEEEQVLPWLGGAHVTAPPGRKLRLAARPAAPGWWRFKLKGRVAAPAGPAEAPSLSDLPGLRGHLVAGRLFVGGRTAPEEVAFLPEDEPPPFAPARARRWVSGELLFDALDFEGDAEEGARRALEDGGSLAEVKGAPPSLRAAFAWATARAVAQRLGVPASPIELLAHAAAIADGGPAAAEAALAHLAEERRRAAEERRRLVGLSAALERVRAGEVVRVARAEALEDRLEAALAGSGADYLSSRGLAQGMVEVVYRFSGQRFITIVEIAGLRVVDAGVCLAGSDRVLTLDSLPSVLREAIDTGQLVITRRDDD